MKKIFLILFVGLLVLSSPARGDTIFGEFQRLPDEIERGFSVGFDFGLLFFTGDKRSSVNPGFALAFNTGYDILDYLSVEGVYLVAINEANPADPVLTGGVNTFMFHLVAKGQLPLGRFRPFISVGPGLHHSRPQFIPPKNNKIGVLMSGGLEYYTYLRHYSLYLKGSYYYSPLPVDALTFSAGLKYTF